MKIETILNAMELAVTRLVLCRFGNDEKWDTFWNRGKLERQSCAFRARILRMWKMAQSIHCDNRFEIDMLQQQLAEKDAEIEKWKDFARNKEEPKRRGRR